MRNLSHSDGLEKKVLVLEKRYDKVLFDMDGTLLDSRPVLKRVWKKWAVRNGLNFSKVLHFSHGRRLIDTVRQFSTGPMNIDAEVEWLAHEEFDDIDGITAIPGAESLLNRLGPYEWAVVTSAGKELACKRFAAAGLPLPKTLVTADDVKAGKPNPEGFELAAGRLGTTANNCLVFEDAPAGIQAAKNAGSDVIAIGAAQPHAFEALCPTVQNFELVSFQLHPSFNPR